MAPAPFSPIRRFRVLAGALMGSLVVVGIALTFVVTGSRTSRSGLPVHTEPPSLGVYVAIVVLGVVVAGLIQALGYRIPAIPAGLDATQSRTRALAAYQQSMILRFALAEVVAIVTIAALFAIRSNTVLPYVVAAVISEVLMLVHVWPSSALVERVRRRLDRDGGRSDLVAVLNGTA